MSLSAKKIGLVVISALFVFSCKKKENIGIQLASKENAAGVFFTDTIQLETKVVLENDSLPTNSYLFTGAYTDPIFGNVTAEGFTHLKLQSESPTITYTAVDSVVMHLNYSYTYGDTLVAQTINVRKLIEYIDPEKAYYSTAEALSNDGVLQDSVTTFYPTPASNPVVDLYLKASFGKELLDLANSKQTTDEFQKELKGIELSAAGATNSVTRINISSNVSYIKVYYSNGATKSDFTFYFTTGSELRNFSRIISDRSKDPLLSSLVNSGDQTDAGGKVYVQSLLGINTKITLPTLLAIKSKLGNIIINRAELVIGPDPATLGTIPPVDYLNVIKLNSKGEIMKYSYLGTLLEWDVQNDAYDVHGTGAPQIVLYNSSLKSYTFNISSYLNALLQGTEANNGLIIAPDPARRFSTLDRFKAESGSVKLKVYYTKAD